MEKMAQPYAYGAPIQVPTIEWDLAVRIPKKRYTTLSSPSVYKYAYRPEGTPLYDSPILVKCVWKAEYWVFQHQKEALGVQGHPCGESPRHSEVGLLPGNLSG